MFVIWSMKRAMLAPLNRLVAVKIMEIKWSKPGYILEVARKALLKDWTQILKDMNK